MSGATIEEVRELLEYVRGYFHGQTEVPNEDDDPKSIANAILSGALEQVAREMRLHGLLEMSLTGLGKKLAELCEPRTFRFLGMANALESAAGIALMAEVLHEKIAAKNETAGFESEVIQ